MDYDSIVFLGEFHVPNSAVIEINQDLGSNCSPKKFLLHQLVQAVCRTRIRMHTGDPIHIFYTEDWSPGIMISLENYLNGVPDSNDVYLDDLNIRPKWREAIRRLSEHDIDIINCIRQKINYKVEYDLDCIYSIIPFYEKKIRSYYPLINYLRKLGIELNITSRKSSNGGGDFLCLKRLI